MLLHFSIDLGKVLRILERILKGKTLLINHRNFLYSAQSSIGTQYPNQNMIKFS